MFLVTVIYRRISPSWFIRGLTDQAQTVSQGNFFGRTIIMQRGRDDLGTADLLQLGPGERSVPKITPVRGATRVMLLFEGLQEKIELIYTVRQNRRRPKELDHVFGDAAVGFDLRFRVGFGLGHFVLSEG